VIKLFERVLENQNKDEKSDESDSKKSDISLFYMKKIGVEKE